MQIFQRLLFLTCSLFLTQCSNQQQYLASKEEWCDSTATITQIDEHGGAHGYMYTLEYDIPESTAINREGKKITSPIQQYSLSSKKPVLNQKIPLQYLKEEPIIFKLLRPIKFQKITNPHSD